MQIELCCSIISAYARSTFLLATERVQTEIQEAERVCHEKLILEVEK